MNYEVIPTPIPRNKTEVESFEAWLERASAAGAELVTISPSVQAGTILCIFRVHKKGAIAPLGV